MSDKPIKTAITPAAHTTPPAKFSPGVRMGSILQVAGQVGFLPVESGGAPTLAGTGLREQSLQTLANVTAVLEEGGARWDDVLMVRVYLTDPAHFAEFNALYDAYLADHLSGPQEAPPARTTVYVGLPPGFLVEIDAMAVLSDPR